MNLIQTPGLNGNAVAELTISKMLELARHTVPACNDVKMYKHWDKYKFMGQELRGQGHTFSVLLLKDLSGEVGVVGHDLHLEGPG